MTMLEEALEGLAPPSPELVIEVLERASKLIQNDGWCQGKAHTVEVVDGQKVYTGHCLVGAVSQATYLVSVENNLGAFSGVWGTTRRLVEDVTPGGDVPTYNDESGRTQAEVLDVLQTALDRARGF